MKIKLPRTMQMRIMLAIAVLQMLVVGLFSLYWIVQEVGEELTSRQSIAHKILSLTVPSVERALYQETPDELAHILIEQLVTPFSGGAHMKFTIAFHHQQRDRPAALHLHDERAFEFEGGGK